jgi:hypothetical protein
MAYQKEVEEYGTALSEANVQMAISEKQYRANKDKLDVANAVIPNVGTKYSVNRELFF